MTGPDAPEWAKTEAGFAFVATTRETAWLIERRSAGLSPQWMSAGQRPGDHAWTWSANEAIKFKSREEAEAACNGGHINGPLLVTEHAFIDMSRKTA